MLDNSASQNTCPVSQNAVHERNTRETTVSNIGDQALSSGANIRNQPQLYLPIHADVIESRTRELNLPRLEEGDDIVAYVRALSLDDFPGRPIQPSDVSGKYLSYSDIWYSIKSKLDGIVHHDQPYESALPTVADGKRQISYLKRNHKQRTHLSLKEYNLLFQYNKSTYFAYNILLRGLARKKAIVLLYCEDDDDSTYYELIWHPNDKKYTAETLFAYHTRYYHYVAYTAVDVGMDTETTEDFLRQVLKSPSANICDGKDSKSGNIVFYSL
ncbi:hypothetical protein IWQ62_005174 [Dispira parvispora]|uniref:Uncharacterized protein n=1 Tax=Dispira parvispora TaxID=1520584 RepID=A0A9W8AQX8_9FUNG|nr:hypothetical protein IWQ62_005174 [Dispira parvispora]